MTFGNDPKGDRTGLHVRLPNQRIVVAFLRPSTSEVVCIKVGFRSARDL